MKVSELPRGVAQKALEFPHFPTRFQAVVWRNWGLVPVEKLAQVLDATRGQIEALASDMGLQKDDSLCPLWHERGYITLLRRNWHLLPYEQILTLLDWTPDEMAYVLKEDDFLWHKFGDMKPEAFPVRYAPLSATEIQQTARLKEIISKYFPDPQAAQDNPFGFLKRYGKYPARNSVSEDRPVGLRLTYSYSAVYGDPLLNENLDPYPEGLLADYAATGINAVWLQGTLYTLVPWLGESKYSEGWEIRIANLRKLCTKAEKYGIRVYLYLNEPRSMPLDFFETHPDWRGPQARDGLSCALCTSKEPVRNALKNGISDLFRWAPELSGIFTITMSENLTHCGSRLADITAPCPVCSARGPDKIVAEINQVIAEGAHRIQPEAEVIAWTWAWSPEWDEKAVERLPTGVKLMCVSETHVPTEAMGVKGLVVDYSISKVGPGPISSRLWKKAQDCGLRVIAKVQINNTWECSAVPYIPALGLVEKHLRNLEAAGVKDLMLNWTLGGYPGGNFDLLKMPKEKLAVEKYGETAAPFVLKAWACFDRAFEEFPIHGTDQLYTAPQNCGPMNLLAAAPTGYKATMVGFPYDDLESWRGSYYPEDVFEEQFRKVSTGWSDGLEDLEQAGRIIPANCRAALEDLANVAEATYCHFRSTYLQIRFVRLRTAARAMEIKAVLGEEMELAQRLHSVMLRDSRIGFEASSHYYYTANDLKEKILNCEWIGRKL